MLGLRNVLTISARFVRIPRTIRPKLRDLYQRRLAQGPEPYRHRSCWIPWNYDAELHCFKNRFTIPLDTDQIRVALIDESYDDTRNNQSVAPDGRETLELHLKELIRQRYPKLPADWRASLLLHLTTERNLGSISAHFGVNDLLLYRPMDKPADLHMLTNALYALIGLVKNDAAYVTKLIDQFILSGLTTEYFAENEIFPDQVKTSPSTLLHSMLKDKEVEFRLMQETAKGTILSTYMVGVYVDKEYFAHSFGETVEIAVEEAAREAMFKLVGIADYFQPPRPLQHSSQISH